MSNNELCFFVMILQATGLKAEPRTVVKEDQLWGKVPHTSLNSIIYIILGVNSTLHGGMEHQYL